MFHVIHQEPIVFLSNPPLEPMFAVELSTNDEGSPINKYVLKERSNVGLKGCHYDPSIMSLRARLARGVELQKVNYDCVENDPNVITRKARQFVSDLESSIASRSTVEPTVESTVEPANTEPANT